MGLKPMNCPAHIQIYKDERRSYRDLPIRYAEQGLVHRHEPSGTLHGLLRVRHITQDDAHIFCTEDQIEEEVLRCLDFGFFIYDLFGFEPRLELSTRPDKRIGTEEMWDTRRGGARSGRSSSQGLEYELNEGDGAFYGPKIDLHMTDSIGRSLAARHRAARLPDARALRARLHRRRQRRAPAGDDPPRAAGLVRALHRHPDRALRAASSRSGSRRSRRWCCRSPTATPTTRARSRPSCDAAGLRAEVDDRTESIGKKIREGELRKAPYMLVVGDKEAEAGTVSVRRHREGDLGAMDVDEFALAPRDEIDRRSSRAVADSAHMAILGRE